MTRREGDRLRDWIARLLVCGGALLFLALTPDETVDPNQIICAYALLGLCVIGILR